MTADYGLRILAMFRLINRTAEIRLAAGREIHFGQRQGEALQVASSMFVSGYLNVRGSEAEATVALSMKVKTLVKVVLIFPLVKVKV